MNEMTSRRRPPVTGTLVFHDFHAPEMPAGDYRLAVQHDIQARANEKLTGKESLTIRVGVPQISLPTGTVTGTFPANVSSATLAITATSTSGSAATR